MGAPCQTKRRKYAAVAGENSADRSRANNRLHQLKVASSVKTLAFQRRGRRATVRRSRRCSAGQEAKNNNQASAGKLHR